MPVISSPRIGITNETVGLFSVTIYQTSTANIVSKDIMLVKLSVRLKLYIYLFYLDINL